MKLPSANWLKGRLVDLVCRPGNQLHGVPGVDTFRTLMFTANQIAKQNPAALSSLICAILRPEQSELLLGAGERGQDACEKVDGYSFFFESLWDVYETTELRPIKREPSHHRILLARDLVLPCPWNSGRYIDALSNIGEGKIDQDGADLKNYGGRWRQDDNHAVELWLPWRIGFVTGGNHSIAAGILAGEGSLIPHRVYDFDFIFDCVTCDGREYRFGGSREKMVPVKDVRRAAVFEIGRLIALARSRSVSSQ